MAAFYSLDSSPLAWVSLPVTARFGSDFYGQADRDIEHETDGGQRWIYRQHTKRVWRLQFRLTEAQLANFRTMHDAVDGALTAFYFQIDTTILYCRKESGFSPQMLSTPINPRMFDYTLVLTEELEPEEF